MRGILSIQAKLNVYGIHTSNMGKPLSVHARFNISCICGPNLRRIWHGITKEDISQQSRLDFVKSTWQYLDFALFVMIVLESRPSPDQKVRCRPSSYAADNILTQTGCFVHVILLAMVCDKPAAYKIRGFASYSHTNFCSLCWILVHDKGKPTSFQYGGGSYLHLIPF
jgi:hypothetical protein